MLIDITKFAKLFDNKIFLGWMRANASSELKDVLDAKDGPTFRPAVIGAYNKLYSSSLQEKFQKFISDKFPQVINKEEELPLTARLLVPSGDDPNQVFSCYNPHLLRFPMQIAFKSNSLVELEQAVQSFVIAHRSEHVQMIVGDMAYIEYIPDNLTKHNVPKRHWEIKNWKAKNKVR